jgi:hypothetical protein
MPEVYPYSFANLQPNSTKRRIAFGRPGQIVPFVAPDVKIVQRINCHVEGYSLAIHGRAAPAAWAIAHYSTLRRIDRV